MKKVCLAKKGAEDIKFLLRGQRHGEGANEIEINSVGIVVADEDAVLLEERLGMQITVTDVNAKDVSKQATEALAAASGASGASEPSDAVKALAEEHEIDLDTIVGTGANGNIVKKDVEAAIKEKEEAAAKE